MKNLKESAPKTPRRLFRLLSRAGGGSLAGAAALLGLLAAPGTARAEYTVTYEQVGTDVVATGSGTIDTAALTYAGPANIGPFVWSDLERFANGTGGNCKEWFGTVSGPSSFGTGGLTSASSASGDLVGFVAGGNFWLPAGYVSGSPLSDTATYAGETLAGLGLTPGDYTWTWGSGPTADSFNLDIEAVPEPTSVALAGLGGLALLGRRRTRNRWGKSGNQN